MYGVLGQFVALIWRARYTDVRRRSSISESFELPCQSSVVHNSVRDERPTWSPTSNFSFFQATETFSSRCKQALSFRGRRVMRQGEPRVAPLSISRLSSFTEVSTGANADMTATR
jgi:hypothetical protein